jgi:gluconokinase
VVIIMMGVSGSGKTTTGRTLAENLGWPFYEGDDFHPEANVEKMTRGIALTDTDRKEWLDRLSHLLAELERQRKSAVVSCSALKESYRQRLSKAGENLRFVFLKGDYELLEKRLRERKGHYMGAGLLRSQFQTLEEPKEAIVVNVASDPQAIVAAVKRGLGL